MAIRFDASYNKEIRRVVDAYNHKRRRMIKAGHSNIPDLALVSELKNRYDTRSDLNRELNRLRKFTRGDILQKVELAHGKISKYNYELLKVNQENALEYFQKEYQRVSKRVGRFPGEKTYLDNIDAKIKLLSKDLKSMNEAQLRTAAASVKEYNKVPTRLKHQFRGFLSEVDWVMEKLDIPPEERDAFFNKFQKLTPTQFLYMYDNNDIIARIYRLYHKNTGESAYLTDTTENAEDLIDELILQADVMVDDAILNSD